MIDRGWRKTLTNALAVDAASAVLLSGCAGAGQSPGGNGPAAGDAGALAAEKAAQKADSDAMDCVTGAWEATTSALQALFDEAIAESGVSDFRIIVDGSIVYEFLETGFGANVIPTAFTMTMPTVVGEEWQNGLTMRWTFAGETMDVDTGAQSMVQGLTDTNRFTCAGNELVLQSRSGPPLALVRMTEIK